MVLAVVGAACAAAALLVALHVVRQRNPKLRAQRLERLRANGQKAMQACLWDKAIRFYGRASRLAVGPELADAHRQTGVCRQAQGRLSEAEKSFAEAMKAADRCGDKEGKARALGNLGLVWQRRGAHSKALAYYEQSIALGRELGARMLVATAHSNLGLLWKTAGDLDRALDCFRQALSVFQELGAKPQLASVLGNIALVHMDREELDSALEHLNRTLEVARQIGDRRTEANALGNIAGVRLAQHLTNKALDGYEALLKVHREMGDLDGEARDHVGIGDALVRKGDYEAAASYLTQALKAFLKLGIAEGPRKCLFGLRMCLTVLGVKEFSAVCENAKLEPRTVTELVKVLELRPTTPTAR
jgi:tetratricopeptide (TPR) repeat protein